MALIVGRGKEHKVYHYQLDHIGTPTDLTDTRGKAVWSAQYLAYGTIYTQHTEEVTNPLRFQGQYFDQETGLHYNRHRYYNPKSGLFTTADPIGLAGGLNNYQYVKNPTGFVDPLGLENVPMVGGGCGGKSESSSSGDATSQLRDEVKVPGPSVTATAQKSVFIASPDGTVITEKPDFVVSPNGTVMPTSKDFNLVDSNTRNGDWFQIHNNHTDAKVGNFSHTHYPKQHGGSRTREIKLTSSSDLDYADNVLKSGTMRERQNRRDKGG